MQKLGLMVLLVSGGVFMAGQVSAGMNMSCLKDARANRQVCMQQCTDDFQAATFLCRNIDPACGAACRAGHDVCIDNINAILQTGQLPDGTTLANCSGGTNQCDSDFQTAHQACIDAACQQGSGQCSTCHGDTTCQDCVDSAQIAHFVCSDACRDSWRANQIVKDDRKTCAKSVSACVKACPPPPAN